MTKKLQKLRIIADLLSVVNVARNKNLDTVGNMFKIKANTAGLDVNGTWPLHADLTIGFWCVNSEQETGICADFQVSFCCPKKQYGTCDTGYDWTDFTNKDDPGGVGDWEHPNKMEHCKNPIAVKAESLTG